jgi:hypothetical protein
VAGAGSLSLEEVDDAEQLIAGVGGRVELKPALVSNAVGRRSVRSQEPTVIWHVPIAWLES